MNLTILMCVKEWLCMSLQRLKHSQVPPCLISLTYYTCVAPSNVKYVAICENVAKCVNGSIASIFTFSVDFVSHLATFSHIGPFSHLRVPHT